jgi:hypothetical protein
MMKTTAFLTLTGSGTVMKLWLTQILTAGAAAPELLLLLIAVAGLGFQTLHSDTTRDRMRQGEDRPKPHPADDDAVLVAPSDLLSRA